MGAYTDNSSGAESLNEVLHWNGEEWSQASIPNVGGAGAFDFNSLDGVTCASATSCWAVGTYYNDLGWVVNDAIHWDGMMWSSVSIPTPGPNGVDDQLVGITCTSPAHCQAVGQDGNKVNQALDWNGKQWSTAGEP